MKSFIAALFVLLSPTLVLAAEHGEAGAHAEGIPTVVWYQFINFFLYAALMVFLFRKPVREYFKNRETAFKQSLIRAEQARRDAETKRRLIQERLEKLQSTTDTVLAQAKAEAEELKARILNDAAALSENLKVEARRTAELEVERAKNELREDLLNQSVVMARKMLSERIAETDQKRLQTEFVDKIQVVR
jgi:F-type H+-transporting ATPase subunit b